MLTVFILQDMRPTPDPTQPTTTPLSVVQYKIALESKKFYASIPTHLWTSLPLTDIGKKVIKPNLNK